MAESVQNKWVTEESHSRWTKFFSELTTMYKDIPLECDINFATVNETHRGILYEAQKYRELIAWGAIHMDAFAPYLDDPEGFCRLSNSMLVCLKYNVTVDKPEQTAEFIRSFLGKRNTRKVWGAIKKHVEKLHSIIGATKNIRDIENIARKYLEKNVIPYQIEKATDDFERIIRNDLDTLSRPLSDEIVNMYIYRVMHYIGVRDKTPTSAEHWTDSRTKRHTLINMWISPAFDDYIKLLFVSVLFNKPRPIIKCEKLNLDFMNRHMCFNYNPKLPNKNFWRHIIGSIRDEDSKIDDVFRQMLSTEEQDRLMTSTVFGQNEGTKPIYGVDYDAMFMGL